MKPRIDFYTASPDALKAMMALETAVSKLPLEKSLIELVKSIAKVVFISLFAWWMLSSQFNHLLNLSMEGFPGGIIDALDLLLWLESDRMGHLLGAIDQAAHVAARRKALVAFTIPAAPPPAPAGRRWRR